MQTGKKGIRIIIAGGKTGGHLFPGIAIAQAVKTEDESSEILFVGTGEKFETETLEKYGFANTKIDCSGIKGKSIKAKLVSIVQIPFSIFQAIKIIKKFKPDIVLGVGGYSSGPVVLGAKITRILTAIHEQNYIPGLTNRILSRFVDIIFTSFENTKGLPESEKIICFGNPVRRSAKIASKDFLETSDTGVKTEKSGEETKNKNRKTDTGKAEKKFTILVTGGSQGASSINRAFLDAVKLMDHPENYRIIHQTGRFDEKMIVREYENMGINAEAKAFFYNMPVLQEKADLIICRAGAGTLSEISAKGKASILIPYPYAANDHQRYNAEFMAGKGAAWVIADRKVSGKLLKEKIEFAEKNPGILSSMAGAAEKLSMPHADKNIAVKCIQLAEKAKEI